MSRPEFPRGTILPVECIRRINEDQRIYDQDPEAWERRERERREEFEREQQRMREEEAAYDEQRRAEREQQQAEEDQLPF